MGISFQLPWASILTWVKYHQRFKAISVPRKWRLNLPLLDLRGKATFRMAHISLFAMVISQLTGSDRVRFSFLPFALDNETELSAFISCLLLLISRYRNFEDENFEGPRTAWIAHNVFQAHARTHHHLLCQLKRFTLYIEKGEDKARVWVCLDSGWAGWLSTRLKAWKEKNRDARIEGKGPKLRFRLFYVAYF